MEFDHETRRDTLGEINRRLKSLKKAEQAAARFVLDNPEQVALLPLRHLAAQCGVSEPTILRFCRGLGFSGYQDFKMSLIPQLLKTRDEAVDADRNEAGWGEAFTHTVTTDLQNTLRSIDWDVVDRAAMALVKAKRILAAGLGGAFGVAYILADSLTGLGKICSCSSDPSYLQVVPGSLSAGDLVIGVSHSGETEEIVNLITRSSENGVATIAISNYQGAPLETGADITLYTGCREDLLGSYAPSTRISELIVVTSLIERVKRRMD